MKKTPLIETLPPVQRRRFMKMLGLALAAPAVARGVRQAARALAVGEARAAEMEDQEPIYFIEINLRDQWDFGHVFVAPGLATEQNLIRGSDGRKCAMYFMPEELLPRANNVFLTPLAIPLDPHLDTIAMIETCEIGIGQIHGHEASNALRSPGRSPVGGPGRMSMAANEPVPYAPGNDDHFSSTPTPASLHNHWMRQLDPNLRSGVTFKGIGRDHTAYHFGAGLPGAELDRIQSRDSLFNAFPDKLEDFNVLPTPQQANALLQVLTAADSRFLDKYGYIESVDPIHRTNLEGSRNLLYVGEPKLISLPLSEQEVAYWSEGVPDQVTAKPKANIWEQCAWAFKLISNDLVRTFSIEFDYIDWHDERPEDIMDTLAMQTVLPLARLIESLKIAGIYDRTLIALYTLDSGRSPAANSSGSEGKCGLMLAGGMIKGGYYGDVGVDGPEGDGHRYYYRSPDPATGAPTPKVTDNSNRLSGAHVWKTVMKALKIPDDVADQFPDVQGVPHLPWILKA
ncbi:MAG: DUF1501 domain-containing protein [Myxococcales bacterium]|nr:DUF1501 domain-containing protein [Myxococcales bacterium]